MDLQVVPNGPAEVVVPEVLVLPALVVRRRCVGGGDAGGGGGRRW